MTATDLIDCCWVRDIRLWVESGKLRFDAPRGAIGPELRAELFARKAELLELLTTLDDLAKPTKLPPLPCPVPHSTGRRWRCDNPYCFNKKNWWMSRHGVVQCANCKPPGFPDLVIASGDASNAPTVEPDCFRQAVEVITKAIKDK